ncbi:MAG TPA: histidine kinase, partial [Aquabacterium sp.]|nr:histidine kinase [Aquabacterium sp.]
MTRSHRTATTRGSTRSTLRGVDDQSTRPADSQASWFGAEDPVELITSPTDLPGIASDPSAYIRLYRAFLAARAAVGLIVVAGIATSTLLERGEFNPQLMAVASVYAVLAVVWWWWPSQRTLRGSGELGLSSRQSLATVGVDLVFFGLLNQLDRNININPAALMALPVLMASVLMPRFMALGAAAAATLILLGTAIVDNLLRNNLGSSLPSAGLTGFGLFAVALVVSELSSRLAREQRSARGNMALARQQAQLNRLVIDEMPEGVL